MGAAFDRAGDRRRHGSRVIGREGKRTEIGWPAGDEAKVGRESGQTEEEENRGRKWFGRLGSSVSRGVARL